MLLLLPGVSALHAQPRKLALLIGIDEYPQKPLKVCNGIPLLRHTLLAQGFSEKDILTLTNSEATRQNILQAIQTHLGQAQKGDIALLHYTGHGHQIPDDNNDEADRLDEALMLMDADLIRDDELSEHLHALRQQIGPSGQVFVMLDACHTGSGTRSHSHSTKANAHSLLENKSKTTGATLAPMVAFFASRPQERSFQINGDDGQPYGPLTYAFCKAMQQATPKTTYRGLFDRITWRMLGRNPNHTPQAEGNLDRQLFGGQVEAPPKHFKIYTVIKDNQARVEGGLLSGLRPGAEVALYPIDTRDTSGIPPLSFGHIRQDKASLLECTLELDRCLPKEQFEQAWVFIRKCSFAGYNIGVRANIRDLEMRQSVKNALSAMPTVRMDADNPDLLLSQSAKGQLTLRSTDSTTLALIHYNPQKPEQAMLSLRDAINKFAQAQFLRELEFEGSPYQVGFNIAATSSTSAAPATVRADKDVAVITVTNRSTSKIYYTILDIDGSNKVSVLLPGNDWSPSDFVLAPGQSATHKASFDTPGMEFLKLIATPSPIDLRGAVATRGRGQRGQHFMEQLFFNTYPDASPNQRGPANRYAGNEAGVATVVLEVIK